MDQPVNNKQTVDTHETLKLSTSSDPHHSHKTVLLGLGALLLLIIGSGMGYFLGNNNQEDHLANTAETILLSPTSLPQISPTQGGQLSADIPADWKTYTSKTEKASFKYPADWTVTKPAIESNYPDADQTAVKNPSGTIRVSWVSALSGFGGACDHQLSPEQGGCPFFTLMDKTLVKNATNLYVVTGIITKDGKIYAPFLAVQDKNGVVETGPTMGYDMFTGKNNGSLPDNHGNNTTALFSIAGAYAGDYSLTKSEALAYFDRPEVKQAKLILLSLTY